jgi:hypothetical protein
VAGFDLPDDRYARKYKNYPSISKIVYRMANGLWIQWTFREIRMVSRAIAARLSDGINGGLTVRRSPQFDYL